MNKIKENKNIIFVGIVILLITIIAFIRALKVGSNSDFFVFYDTSIKFIDKMNIYFVPDRELQFLYPPFAALFFNVLFPFSFKISAIIWSLLLVVLWIVNIYLSKNLVDVKSVKWKQNVLLATLFSFNFFLDNLNLLQVNSLILVLMLLSFSFYKNENFKYNLFYSSFLLALSISIKVTPIIFIFYFLLNKDFKFLFYLFMSLLILNLSPIIFRGTEMYIQDIQVFLSTLKQEIPNFDTGLHNYHTYSLRSGLIEISKYLNLSKISFDYFVNTTLSLFFIIFVSILVYYRKVNSTSIKLSLTMIFILLFSAVTRKAHMLVLLFPIMTLLFYFDKDNFKKLRYVLYFIGISFVLTGRDIIGNKIAELLISFHYFTILMIMLFSLTFVALRIENKKYSK